MQIIQNEKAKAEVLAAFDRYRNTARYFKHCVFNTDVELILNTHWEISKDNYYGITRYYNFNGVLVHEDYD